MSDLSGLLPNLERIAKRAGHLALESRKDLKRFLKPDGSLVTNGDRDVEALLRKELTTLVPGTTVWGEELGHSQPGPGGLWAVDPIDGTSNYTFGSPLWGVSIALIQGNNLELGAISIPDLDELYLAARGHGATCNGKCLKPIPPGPIKPEELVSYNDHVQRALPGCKLPGKMRLSGAFIVDGMFVARQRYRGLIGVREKLYDIAASLLILSELDADIRFADGSPMPVGDLLEDRPIGRPWIAFPRRSGFIID